MAEYISRNEAINAIKSLESSMPAKDNYAKGYDAALGRVLIAVRGVPPATEVQSAKCCKMIPHKPDCRGYTDTFFCTNCQIHIHLGFIGQRYGGNYCIECGAEVEDGDNE